MSMFSVYGSDSVINAYRIINYYIKNKYCTLVYYMLPRILVKCLSIFSFTVDSSLL